MRKLAFFAAFALVSIASSARADNTITLHDYIVYGRAARPMAVTEVTKLPMQATVTDLKQPFVQRVEQAVQSKPF